MNTLNLDNPMAAPQLLEALQTTAENLRSWKAASNSGIKTFDSWLEVVEEAIAAATGGQQ